MEEIPRNKMKAKEETKPLLSSAKKKPPGNWSEYPVLRWQKGD